MTSDDVRGKFQPFRIQLNRCQPGACMQERGRNVIVSKGLPQVLRMDLADDSTGLKHAFSSLWACSMKLLCLFYHASCILCQVSLFWSLLNIRMILKRKKKDG